jgi:hypothetical protein
MHGFVRHMRAAEATHRSCHGRTLPTQGLYVLCFKPSTSNVWVPQMRPLASVYVIGMANGGCDKAACGYVYTAWRGPTPKT